ncbi:MAG: fibrinogen-like YCDxxxxGGGW domain-containing protein [Actinomycetaceae bacterium]|nr:fibrinogen-like YCDxxxxGGGW domain-containing protein [Actinomycetaceae bacterium]
MSVRRLAAPLAAITAFVAVNAFLPSAPAQAAPVLHDGLSPATAAASCWEIKQNDQSAQDGAYWLLTPTMTAPEQFFCDQTTDGGGWVLIGRGREGWDTYARGQGDPRGLLTRDRTPASFGTIQLSEEKVNGLLGGTAIKSQPDPVRIVRAADNAGTHWQNVDMTFSTMNGWEWPFRSYHAGKFQINGGGYWNFGSLVGRFGYDNGWNGLDLSASSNSKYLLGFAYGAGAPGGSADASAFHYRNGGQILPYSEVYLRPHLRSDDGFARIDDAGTPEKILPPTVSDLATPTSWGVVGNLNGRVAEGNSPVQAFAQIGSTIFVGGNFTGVQQGSQGGAIGRTALAAFDSSTGDFKPEFNATFNGQVKDLGVLPDGNLLVAGEFTIVNGARHVGTVLLDPATGATIDSWNLEITNRISSSRGVVSVRAIDVDGDKVYLGGSFTHLSGQGTNNVYSRHGARVSLNGKPDRSWNPEFNGTVMDLDASGDKGRFYAAGFFSRTRGEYMPNAAVLSTEAGAARALPFEYKGSVNDVSDSYQQAVLDTGSLVFFGGSEHAIFGYEPSTMQRVSGSITAHLGGDMQAMASDGTVIYAGCHCFDRAYQDAYTWSIPYGFTKATRVQGLGAWDAATGALYSWTPYRLRSKNAGAWELFVAEDGALWVGGDFIGSINTKGRNQWNGGWIRYGAQDRQAPATPAKLAAFADESTGEVSLSWEGVADAARYQVLRDDRVVAEVGETHATIPAAGDNRFFIRAIDASGNISASSPVATPQAPPAQPTSLVADSAQWSYYYATQAPAAEWLKAEFDDSSWARGAAPLGYGAPDVTTTLTPLDPTRPVASYYRTSFDVADPKGGGDYVLSYVADDGAVVYVNGVEVSRTRMDKGTVSHETRANRSVNTPTAVAERTEITIPREVLKSGKNVIAVETHLNFRNSRSMTFRASVSQLP